MKSIDDPTFITPEFIKPSLRPIILPIMKPIVLKEATYDEKQIKKREIYKPAFLNAKIKKTNNERFKNEIFTFNDKS